MFTEKRQSHLTIEQHLRADFTQCLRALRGKELSGFDIDMIKGKAAEVILHTSCPALRQQAASWRDEAIKGYPYG